MTAETCQPTRLYVLPRTQLQTIWRTVDPRTGELSWHVYTACADASAPWREMQGTALQLSHDGEAIRYTEHGDDLRMMTVLPPVGENK